jgi:hypothetical protein
MVSVNFQAPISKQGKFYFFVKNKKRGRSKNMGKNYKPQQQLKTVLNTKLVKRRQTNISGVFSLQQFQINFQN